MAGPHPLPSAQDPPGSQEGLPRLRRNIRETRKIQENKETERLQSGRASSANPITVNTSTHGGSTTNNILSDSTTQSLQTEVASLKAEICSMRAATASQLTFMAGQMAQMFDIIKKMHKEQETGMTTILQDNAVLKTHQAKLTKTYATVAAKATEKPSTKTPTPPEAPKEPEPKIVQVDLSKLHPTAAETITDAREARTAFNACLGQHEKTKDVKLKAFTYNTVTKMARLVVTREHERDIRSAEDWTNAILPGARVLGPEWYRFKVDLVERSWACEPGSTDLTDDILERFGEENGIQVLQCRQLGAQSVHKRHFSMVVAVPTEEQRDRCLNGEVTAGGNTCSIKPYIKTYTPRRCHCQTFHNPNRCSRPCRCVSCGGLDHEDCEADVPTCVNCSGSHKASSNNCPVYQAEKRRLQARAL